MSPKRRAASADSSRLKVLSAGDERAFLEASLEMLASRDRLQREAALEALAGRPLADARAPLRALYSELDRDGLKHDQGALQRVPIVRTLRAIHDLRDRDIAIRASETIEIMMGQDVTWQLRVHGLMMLAEIAPDTFPYYAIEHFDDLPPPGEGEPANTAFQLLAGSENYVPVYQWLRSSGRESPALAPVIELFSDAPAAIVRRFVDGAVHDALRRGEESVCTVLAETIVKLELESAYANLEQMLGHKISPELYDYLAMLLAGTNRAPFLGILERQLHGGRRPRSVLTALQVRTTPEQQAILDRYERGDSPSA